MGRDVSRVTVHYRSVPDPSCEGVDSPLRELYDPEGTSDEDPDAGVAHCVVEDLPVPDGSRAPELEETGLGAGGVRLARPLLWVARPDSVSEREEHSGEAAEGDKLEDESDKCDLEGEGRQLWHFLDLEARESYLLSDGRDAWDSRHPSTSCLDQESRAVHSVSSFRRRNGLEHVHVGNDKELDDSSSGKDKAVVCYLLSQVRRDLGEDHVVCGEECAGLAGRKVSLWSNKAILRCSLIGE